MDKVELMNHANSMSSTVADPSRWEHVGPRSVYEKDKDGNITIIPLPDREWEPGTPESIRDPEWLSDDNVLELASFYAQTTLAARLREARLGIGYDDDRPYALITCDSLLTAMYLLKFCKFRQKFAKLQIAHWAN